MSASPGYLELLRDNRDYRNLWLGQVISFLGDWFKTIALFEMVQHLTDSALAIAGVLVAKMLPIFLVVPIAGPLIDRFDRRTLMLVADFVRAGLVVGIIGAYRMENLPLLFAVLVVLVMFSGLFIPARTAVVPQLAPDEQLPVAMALSGGTWSVTLALGAAAGGLATEWVGAEGALWLDALTYLLSAAFLAQLPKLLPTEEDDAHEAGFRAGLRYLRRHPRLALTLLQKPMLGLAGGTLVVLPLYGGGLFPWAGPAATGFLFSARGLGSLVGSMGIRRLFGDRSQTMVRWIPVGFLLMSTSYAVGWWAPTYGWAAAAYLFSALGIGIVWVFSGTLAQVASDRAYRGRLFSMEFGVFTLVSSSVSWGCGELVDLGWTAREVMGATATVMWVPAVLWGLGQFLLGPLGEEPAEQRSS